MRPFLPLAIAALAVAGAGLGVAAQSDGEEVANEPDGTASAEAAIEMASEAAPAPVPADIPVALLVDMSTGQVLFEREADRRFIPASVTKVMTAYTAFQFVDDGTMPLDRRFLVSQQLEDEWSGEGSSMFLKAGDRPTISDLLMGATTVSGNDASVALALASVGSLDGWLERMNENARTLGMKNTHFGSPNGYPDGGSTFTTANDMVRLATGIIEQHPALYERYFGNHGFRWNNITQANHDPISGRVEGADGLKTGFTNEAGYTFVGSAEREGRRLIVVLAGAPTARERDRTARELIEWGFDAFAPARLLASGQLVANAQIQLGAADSVPLVPVGDVVANLPAGPPAALRAHVSYRGPISAPVTAGDELATLHVAIDGQPPFEVPLVAGESVGEAGLFRRIAAGMRSLAS